MVSHQSKPYTALETVLRAGRILMESGAEIYRTEDTMRRMATCFHLQQFEGYVMNRGLVASAQRPDGLIESRVANTKAVQIHLGKLEHVNTLSRQLEKGVYQSPQEVNAVLDTIDQLDPKPLLMTLLAYFFGAGGFTLALGSGLTDALIAALSALVMGLIMIWIDRKVHVDYLRTILASAILTLVVNVCYAIGFGESRSIILLGALMLLVPGVAFVNAIREFSQGNTIVGTSLMVSAIIISSSISVGVAGLIALLPFAGQLSGDLPHVPFDILEITVQTISAGIGTIAFAILYNVSRHYFVTLGVMGAGCWLIYLVLNHLSFWEAGSFFIAALFVSCLSQILAILRRCPATIFLASSMIPLVPGLSVYRSVYFLLIGSNDLAQLYLRQAFIGAFAIAIAIGLTQQFHLHKVLKSIKKY